MFISFLLFGFIAVLVLSLVIFGILFLIIGLVGGASAARFIKNKIVKKMIFLGVSIVSLTGLACILPVLSVYFVFPGNLMWIGIYIIFAIIGILIILGLNFTGKLENRTARIILRIVFIILLIALIFIAIGLLIAKAVLF